MTEVRYKRWLLHCDPEATRAAYALIAAGAPERCGCDPCVNFAANRERVYPPEVRALLSKLGIDYQREAEVYDLGALGGGRHAYGGWFHLIGTIEAGDDAAVAVEGGGHRFELEPAGGGFALGFSRRAALLAASFEGQPVVQLEFTAEADWTIEQPETD